MARARAGSCGATAHPPQEFLKSKPVVACLIVDYQMPGLNGLQTIAEARTQELDMPAVMITATIDQTVGSAAVLWCGWPFFQRGLASIVSRRLNMFSLIALGTGVAYAYSVVAALAPQIFPASFRGPHGEIPLYFEAAAVIVTLVLLGQVRELRARSATNSAIQELLDLAPKRARLIRDDASEEDIPLEIH